MENKPLLLFAPLYDYVAEAFVDKMNEIPLDKDIEIWANCPGGRVFAGWSIIGAMQKRTGKKTVCVMGHAASMMIPIVLFADEVEALEVSQFLIHRADGYVESPEDQAFLEKINKDLRKQMETRLNMELFEQVTGKTLDQIFDPKQRVDLWIDAKQAKKIGLVNKIKKLSPEVMKMYNEKFVAFADFTGEQRSEPEQRSESVNVNNNQKKETKMTKEEFKVQHPALYAEIIAEGHAAGIKAEQVRVKSWLAYLDVDKSNVLASVKDGKDFTPDIMAEMSVKMMGKATAEKIAEDSPEAIATKKAEEKTESEKELEAFEKQVTDNAKKVNIY
jgi:ATP-dependent protease ClpP protease subunit